MHRKVALFANGWNGENLDLFIKGFNEYFTNNDVEEGDYIEIENQNMIYQYKVTGIEIVEPEDVAILDYAEGKNLTLITCTPFMIGTHRLIVHAEMME